MANNCNSASFELSLFHCSALWIRTDMVTEQSLWEKPSSNALEVWWCTFCKEAKHLLKCKCKHYIKSMIWFQNIEPVLNFKARQNKSQHWNPYNSNGEWWCCSANAQNAHCWEREGICSEWPKNANKEDWLFCFLLKDDIFLRLLSPHSIMLYNMMTAKVRWLLLLWCSKCVCVCVPSFHSPFSIG